jgi:hypothetical protein
LLLQDPTLSNIVANFAENEPYILMAAAGAAWRSLMSHREHDSYDEFRITRRRHAADTPLEKIVVDDGTNPPIKCNGFLSEKADDSRFVTNEGNKRCLYTVTWDDFWSETRDEHNCLSVPRGARVEFVWGKRNQNNLCPVSTPAHLCKPARGECVRTQTGKYSEAATVLLEDTISPFACFVPGHCEAGKYITLVPNASAPDCRMCASAGDLGEHGITCTPPGWGTGGLCAEEGPGHYSCDCSGVNGVVVRCSGPECSLSHTHKHTHARTHAAITTTITHPAFARASLPGADHSNHAHAFRV